LSAECTLGELGSSATWSSWVIGRSPVVVALEEQRHRGAGIQRLLVLRLEGWAPIETPPSGRRRWAERVLALLRAPGSGARDDERRSEQVGGLAHGRSSITGTRHRPGLPGRTTITMGYRIILQTSVGFQNSTV
jgi:hypothetical protein